LFLPAKKQLIMADDKTKQDGRDRSKVNPTEDYEVQYFKEKLGVSATQLKEAIQRLGTNDRKKLTDYFNQQSKN
jgi:hypothetical protein